MYKSQLFFLCAKGYWHRIINISFSITVTTIQIFSPFLTHLMT